jgi:pyridoxamine 5'-phosphate oxidase-like protein
VAEPTASHASLPAGYGSASGAPGERLPWARVEEWLAAARNYWLCTTRPDGRPHAKPVWGAWIDGALLYSTSPESVTARDLAAGSALAVHLESGDQVAIFEGMPEPVRDSALLERFTEAYERKYDWRVDVTNRDTPIFALRPESVLAWDAGDSFVETATRWRLA